MVIVNSVVMKNLTEKVTFGQMKLRQRSRRIPRRGKFQKEITDDTEI